MSERTFFVIVLFAAIVAGVVWYLHNAGQSAQESAQVVVTDFGEELQQVQLSLPTAQAAKEIATDYAPYVSPSLLTQWEADPTDAPGSIASSPWPDHITITSVTDDGVGGYRVQGNVIELTSEDVAKGTVSATYPISATVSLMSGKWLITAWTGFGGQ